MQVAFCVDRFPAASTTFILRQIGALLDRGHDVRVYAREQPAEPVLHGEVERYDLLSRATYIGEGPPLDATEWESAAGHLSLGVHDVLHVQMGHTARSFLFAREAVRAPLVVTYRGFDFSAYPRVHGSDCYQAVFEVADAVTYNCEHARGRLLELGCPDSRLSKYTSALDVDEFAFRERTLEPGTPLRLVTVARLTEKKGIDIALRAVASVRRRGTSLHYDIVGDGPLRERLESEIDDLGLSEAVRLHGEQDGAYVRDLLDRAHVFLLASVTAENGDQEGTPVSLMEAQACGLPVLSTLHSGIPEVVADGESGLLVPEGDADALAEGLAELLVRSSEWPEMGRRGREHVARNYDLDTWTARLLALYESARVRRAA